jgi:hypothetical protein
VYPWKKTKKFVNEVNPQVQAACDIDSLEASASEEQGIDFSDAFKPNKMVNMKVSTKLRAACQMGPLPIAPPPGVPQAAEQEANTQEAESTVGSEWRPLWSRMYHAFYYWHVSTGETTWDQPAENGDSRVLQNWGPIGKIPDEYICVKHWQPKEEIESGLTLLQGDRLRVTWTDDCQDGWAYGTSIIDATKEGYFPQQCIALPKRAPCDFVVGQTYAVSDHFQAPQGGYLSVAPQDIIVVLHQATNDKLWVYATIDGGCNECGWIPEAVIAV